MFNRLGERARGGKGVSSWGKEGGLHVAPHRGGGPLEGVAGEEHVPDEGLYGRLPDQPHEE